jgi:FHA domain-containing protein
MHLLIRAVSLAGQPLTQAISAYFDERGGTIGRSDTNTLALPDPERRISRLQAEVSRTVDGGWRILNVGNANPIWHNNKPVPPGEAVLLDEGDELQVGTYALQVNYSKNDATARTITKGRAAVDSRTVIVGSGTEPKTDPGLMRPDARPDVRTTASVAMPAATPAQASSASPFADLLGDLGASSTPPGVPASSASSGSPFDDLMGIGSSSGPVTPSAPVAASSLQVNRLPDDFDPFADLQSTPSPTGRPAASASAWDLPKAAPAPAGASPFDMMSGGASAQGLPGDLDLLGSVAPPHSQSLDHMFGLGGGPSSSADPLADFLKKTEPEGVAQAAVGAPSSVDPLALLSARAIINDGPADSPTQMRSALPDDVPEINAAMSLPPVAEVKAAPSSTQPEPLSATFSFMSTPKPPDMAPDLAEAPRLVTEARTASAADPAAAAAAGNAQTASPFADLGLGAPAASSSASAASSGNGLLDDLDLSPQTVPSVHLARPTPPLADLTVPLSITPMAEPADEAQTPITAIRPAKPVGSMAPPTPEASAAFSGGTADTPTDTQALWAAFCEGAGIKFAPPQGLNPDLMRVIGQLLHHAVDGSLKLVAARAATKQEMRAEVTVIQARRNNPLKFSPDTQSAMEQMLQPPLRGFMSGPEAVADAMDDLLGHTIGTMVGMRAALEGVLGRFEPEQLEAKLVGRSVMDSLLPMNRRAKLWELYLQHYSGVRTEAQDDFHNLFGRAFLQAYEEQLDRLDAERRQAGRNPQTSGNAA